MRDLFDIFNDNDYSRVRPRDEEDFRPATGDTFDYDDDQLQELDINDLEIDHEEF